MQVLRKSDWLRCSTLALSLVVGGRYAVPSAAAAPPPGGAVSQQSVYAAFVVNVTRFIQWPDTAFASPEAPMIIGTFPRDPINEQLDAAVAGEFVGARPLKTIRIRSLDDVARCQVVYLTGSETQKQAVLTRVAQKPILSLSDGDGFIELGGQIQFVPKPPHTQLRISVVNLRAAGLHARSQLLRLAQVEGL